MTPDVAELLLGKPGVEQRVEACTQGRKQTSWLRLHSCCHPLWTKQSAPNLRPPASLQPPLQNSCMP